MPTSCPVSWWTPPIDRWPARVPLQVHYAEHDPWVDAAVADALVEQAERGERFVYSGDGHLFADPDAPEHDATHAAAMLTRVRAFLRGLDPS